MKGLIIGLIIGVTVTWFWYHTDKGKISRTETITITNTIDKTVEKVRYVDQLRWVTVYQTNIVWVTNVVEKVVEVKQVVPVVQEVIKQPIVVQQEAPQPAVIIKPAQRSSAFRGPRPVDLRKSGGKTRLHKNMDGSVTTNYY